MLASLAGDKQRLTILGRHEASEGFLCDPLALGISLDVFGIHRVRHLSIFVQSALISFTFS